VEHSDLGYSNCGLFSRSLDIDEKNTAAQRRDIFDNLLLNQQHRLVIFCTEELVSLNRVHEIDTKSLPNMPPYLSSRRGLYPVYRTFLAFFQILLFFATWQALSGLPRQASVSVRNLQITLIISERSDPV
jgi:hypothetical protein